MQNIKALGIAVFRRRKKMGKIMAIKKITEGTAIPLSLVISISTAVFFLSGSVKRIDFLEVRADSVKERIIKIEESQANFQKDATG